jgi:hypothetical protein
MKYIRLKLTHIFAVNYFYSLKINLMQKFLLLFTVYFGSFISYCSSQCNPTIPSNAVVINYTQMVGSGGGSYWVCSGDTINSGGGSQFIYLEPGAWSIGGGGSETIWVPPGAFVNRPGTGSNTIYYVCPASLIGPGNSPTLIQCTSIHYDYSVAPANGCQQLSTTATCAPIAAFTSSDTVFCNEAGQCLSFTDHSTNSPTSWLWLFPGAVPDSSTQQNPDSICYYTSGTYPVTLIVSNGTNTDTLTVSPMITLVPPPVVPVVTVIGGDTLVSSPAFSYQWYKNGSPISGAIDSFFVATQPGTYSVGITDSLGCSSLSGGVLIASTNELMQRLQVKLYPNPAHDELIIEGKAGNCSLVISDVLGEKVFEESINSNGLSVIVIKNFPAGVYFVHLQQEQSFGEEIFIKQ